jgi:hypothetical protein
MEPSSKRLRFYKYHTVGYTTLWDLMSIEHRPAFKMAVPFAIGTAGEALELEIGKHISEDCQTLYTRHNAKRGKLQPHLKAKDGERDVDLWSPLAAMLKDFIGAGASGLLEHFWSGHARTHVSERYTKLLQDLDYRLEWAEKIGMGFDFPVRSSGLRGLLIPFRKVG